jgi:serine O-acetyltransferase
LSFYGLIKDDIARSHRLQGVKDLDVNFFHVLKSIFNFRFAPVLIYRITIFFSHYRLGFVAKIFSLLNIIFFGIEISTKLKIGSGLFFPHTVGTVLGAKTIGINCTIYQGVTLGAKNIDLIYNPENRPSIGDNVLIAAGAKVLGGITIGNNVTIAANAVVLNSVPDNCIVAGIPAKVIKELNQV